ncbi:MAG: 16S rRNA (cytosine(967)-C(5))-methyltransferase RsmB [Candidatus Sericytochromatia bacterium]
MSSLKKVQEYNTRNIALQYFSKISKNSDNKYVLDEIIKNDKLINERDFSFVFNIVDGTYKNLIFLDYGIDFLIKKNSKIPEIIRDILRISIYQIYFMNSVPDSAAINEGVELTKLYGHKGTVSLVNAVLRNFLRKKEEILNSINSLDLNKKLSITYSYPQWIIDYWLSFLSNEDVIKISESMYNKAPLFIRVNTLKISIEEFINKLLEKNIEFFETEIKEIIKLKENINIKNIYGFNEGYFYVQDLSASMVIKYLNPKENEFIIDFCAFPGGKTSYISQLMNNTGKVLALDISEKRKVRFLENIERLGCKNIDLIIQSGEESLKLNNMADRILVDPPCSGLGVIKRKTDIKYTRKFDDLKRLSDIQFSIVENASKYLKINGLLVYSTCTISKIENEDIINKFLLNNPNFEIEFIDNKQYLNIYPYEKDSDGFFICVLKKISN